MLSGMVEQPCNTTHLQQDH